MGRAAGQPVVNLPQRRDGSPRGRAVGGRVASHALFHHCHRRAAQRGSPPGAAQQISAGSDRFGQHPRHRQDKTRRPKPQPAAGFRNHLAQRMRGVLDQIVAARWKLRPGRLKDGLTQIIHAHALDRRIGIGQGLHVRNGGQHAQQCGAAIIALPDDKPRFQHPDPRA